MISLGDDGSHDGQRESQRCPDALAGDPVGDADTIEVLPGGIPDRQVFMSFHPFGVEPPEDADLDLS